MNLDELAMKVADEITAMSPGASDTMARVVGRVCEGTNTRVEGMSFEIEARVCEILDERGIGLDRSEYAGMFVGLPENIPFVVRPIVNRQRGPIELEDVTRLQFSGYSSSKYEDAVRIVIEGEFGTFEKQIHSLAIPSFGPPDIIPMNVHEIQVFGDAVAKCHFEEWYREYPHASSEEEESAVDGWELTVCLADGSCISCSGGHAYPETFDVLVSALEELGLPDYRKRSFAN